MIDNQQYNYCKKSKVINNILVQNQIFMSNYVTSALFINTQSTQQSKIDVTVHNNDMNSFSLFGSSIILQQVVDSRINVTLSFSVLSAALICTTCDVLVRGSTLIFIASGQQLSGVILTPILSAQFEQSFIQFRLNSSNSSGLVNTVQNTLNIFAVLNCFITGYNYVKSDYNGIASSLVVEPTTLNIAQLTICANQQQLFGSESISVSQVGTETLSCDVCDTSVLVYGICSDGLQFGVEVEGMLQCVFPFEYKENECMCARGYLLNITRCVNVVDNLTDISHIVADNYHELNGSVTDIYNTMHNIDSNIVKNYTSATANLLEISTKLEEYIISNFTLSDHNLLKNTSQIEQRIASNATQIQNTILANFNATNHSAVLNLTSNSSNIEQYILTNFTKNDANLFQNILVLDNRIQVNFTSFNNSLTSSISTLGSQMTASLVANSSKLEQYIIGNYSQVNTYLAQNTSTLDLKINNSFNSLNSALVNNISSLNSSSIASLVANSSKLEQYIASNYSSTNGLLLANTNTLESRIQSNFTSLNNSLANNISALAIQSIYDLKANSSKLEQYIIGNFTVSDTNIKTNVSNLELKLSNSFNQLNSSLAGNISQLNSTTLANLKSNSSNIELYIQSNYSKADGNLLANTSLLDSRIQSNFTSFNNSLTSSISTLGSQMTASLVANSSKLEQYIIGNYSQVNTYLAQNTSTLDLKINNSFNSLNSALVNNISSLNSSSIASLVANSSKLEQYIASNYSSTNGLLLANTNTLEYRIQSNFTSLNSTQSSNISTLNAQLTANLFANASNLEQFVKGNHSNIDNNLQENTSIINNRVFDNTTGVNTALDTIQALIIQLQLQQSCTSVFGYEYLNNSCVLVGCRLYGQIPVNGKCECAPGYYLVNNSCTATQYFTFTSENVLCNLVKVFQIFDLQIISNTASDVSSGFVFPATPNINDAFIDVPDYVFESVTAQLFQAQYVFNNIKIQIGYQTLIGGNFLTSIQDITIKTMSILSSPGTFIQSSGEQSILTSQASRTEILLLTINVNIQSSGNVTLINSARNNLKICSYKFYGSIYSTGTVALISINFFQGIANLTQIEIETQNFKVGNYSSYLLSDVQQSQLTTQNILVKIQGQKSVLTSIYSDNTYFFQFGGLVTYCVQSTIKVTMSVFQNNQSINTEYFMNSGILIGTAYQNFNIIDINQVCLQQQFVNGKTIFLYGIIGEIHSIFTINQCNLRLIINSQSASYIGAVGLIRTSDFPIINNLFSSGQFNCHLDGVIQNYVSGIIAYLGNTQCAIKNSEVSNSKIQAEYFAGGIIGIVTQSSLQAYDCLLLQNTIIINSVINASVQTASSLISYAIKSRILLQNIIVDSVYVISPLNPGLVLGKNITSYITYENSYSKGINQINNVIQTNCPFQSSIPSGC
ncbi:Conserved_hypothetical protein [Hexamita inflata]|uniref:Uncharacterized protein n=1 Tax=Hexamita inflata TaxID=28002 RepID=A0AA86TIW6_9EUKA|nr:Conserved hypothetical protein [Hexamita inflata]